MLAGLYRPEQIENPHYAEVVGKTNVIAGTDCDFASSADGGTVDPEIAWAKLGDERGRPAGQRPPVARRRT